jgi:hypothetical protein
MHLPSRPAAATPMSLVASTSTWHHRLSHLGVDILSMLSNNSSVLCSKRTQDFCHACQLGCHTRMPFISSSSCVKNNFDLIHSDLWTSPIVSVSSYKYDLIIFHDCSHFVRTLHWWLKSNTFITLSIFFAYVSTQFGRIIKVVQCENGHEFNNASSRAFFVSNGVVMWMPFPYTSPQNGKVERTFLFITNMICSLLFEVSIPAHSWVEKGLHTATYLLNCLPTKVISVPYPFVALHSVTPHLSTCVCSVAPTVPTSPPQPLINWHPSSLDVSS